MPILSIFCLNNNFSYQLNTYNILRLRIILIHLSFENSYKLQFNIQYNFYIRTVILVDIFQVFSNIFISTNTYKKKDIRNFKNHMIL